MASTAIEQPDLTSGQAARIMRVSQQTVIRQCDSGHLESYRLPGSKYRRITRPALYEFMRRHGIPLFGWPKEDLERWGLPSE